MNIEIDGRELGELCRRWGVRELALFGSVLREDFGPESDVDVLVEFEPERTPGLGFIDMQEELAALFRREVDLVSGAGLRNPFRRHEILTAKCVIYRASDVPESGVTMPCESRGTGPTRAVRDAGHLWDLLNAAEQAREFTAEVSPARLQADQVLQSATQQVVVHAGRAAGRVSPEFREAHPEIPWDELIAAQRALTERYYCVDEAHVWQLASEVLPALLALLAPLVPPPPEDPEEPRR